MIEEWKSKIRAEASNRSLDINRLGELPRVPAQFPNGKGDGPIISANLSTDHSLKSKLKKVLKKVPGFGAFLEIRRASSEICGIKKRLDQIEANQSLFLKEFYRLSGSIFEIQNYFDHDVAKKVFLCSKDYIDLRERVTNLSKDVREVATQLIPSNNQKTSDHSSIVEPSPSTVGLGALYLQFEDHFRAKPEVLLEGFKEYQNALDQVSDGIKSRFAVDLGCGRGEWLSYLKAQGFRTLGVDSNIAMVEKARDSGHECVVFDAMKFMREQESGSLALVSAFHVIEHISIEALLLLIDETFRVLAAGGIAIFETPNPENILVGASNFYTDPTHLKPVPLHTLDFFLGQRGFKKTDVIRKNRYPLPKSHIQDPALDFVLERFSCGQDYGIVAYKV